MPGRHLAIAALSGLLASGLAAALPAVTGIDASLKR